MHDALISGISLERYWLYLITEGMMAISPGTAVLYAVNRGLAQGFLASTAAAFAVIASNSFYFLLSALGLSALALAYPQAFKLIQYAGAVYLLYLAYGAWTAKHSPMSLDPNTRMSYGAAFRTALFLQLANPKALITFVSIVPPFVNPSLPIAPQMTWLWLGSIVPELFILFAYGALAAKARPYLNDLALRRLIERACAVLLVVIALMVVVL